MAACGCKPRIRRGTLRGLALSGDSIITPDAVQLIIGKWHYYRDKKTFSNDLPGHQSAAKQIAKEIKTAGITLADNTVFSILDAAEKQESNIIGKWHYYRDKGTYPDNNDGINMAAKEIAAELKVSPEIAFYVISNNEKNKGIFKIALQSTKETVQSNPVVQLAERQAKRVVKVVEKAEDAAVDTVGSLGTVMKYLPWIAVGAGLLIGIPVVKSYLPKGSR